jgi:hypothetical protein
LEGFAVSNRPTAFDILKKGALLALIGFGVVVLTGPVIALLSVGLSLAVAVLPFVFVGFCVWTLYRIVMGDRPPWHHWGELASWFGRGLRQFFHMVFQVLALPLHLVLRLGAGIAHVAGAVLGKTWSFVKVMGEIGVITATGVLVGSLVGVYLGSQHHDMDIAVPTNALVGGALAFLAATVMTVLERRRSVRQTQSAS